METILQEISRALTARAYYLAIILALTIPDICSALEAEDGRSHPSKYKDWYNKHLRPGLGPLTDDECYSLRCGVIHQSKSEVRVQAQTYGRIIFGLPNPAAVSVHRVILNDALMLDAVRFCMDVVEATNKWFSAEKNNPIVKKNLDGLVQYRPNGLAPYVAGLPIIT